MLITAEGILFSNIARSGLADSTSSRRFFIIIIRKYISAATLESIVAKAAPTTSFSLGRMTNIKSGSSAILSTPPSIMPMLACSERPSARTRCEKSVLSEVTVPPITTAMSI